MCDMIKFLDVSPFNLGQIGPSFSTPLTPSHRHLPPQIAYVPPELLAQCSRLRTLKLARTALTAWPLPPWPGCLPQLRAVVLAHTPGIRALPQGALASCAPTLVTLDLSGVPGAARMPPGELAACTALETLSLARTGTLP